MASKDGLLGYISTGGKLFIIILLTFLPIGIVNGLLMTILFFLPVAQVSLGIVMYIIITLITLALTFILGGFWSRRIFNWR